MLVRLNAVPTSEQPLSGSLQLTTGATAHQGEQDHPKPQGHGSQASVHHCSMFLLGPATIALTS
jgi:hypothetical protein